jgi:predicted negative regulator of RcsB-dependent stress response
MNDVEEKILSYPHLSVEKKREVEAYVEAHPKWAPLLEDVRSIEHLSANWQSDLPSDALLATYVTVRHLHPDGGEGISPRLRDALSAIDARIENEKPLRREVEAARRRLKEAEAAVDPVSHFEALTGHALDEESAPARVENPEPEPGGSPEGGRSVLEVFLTLPRLARYGTVAATLLVVAYGGLYGVSQATQSTLDRLAAVEVSDQVVESYADTNLRSPAPESEASSVDEQYLAALSTLRRARTSTLGLFPRYDPDALASAKQRLGQVLEQVEPNSFLALEAHFYLGKIALAQEDVDAARSHFKTVVRQKGRQAREAYDILKTLQQEYGMGADE